MKRALLILFFGVLAGALSGAAFSQEKTTRPGDLSQPSAAELRRARKMVHMLDDVYKNTIVMVTSKYVKSENDYPAGRLAVQLFEAITNKGWHDVRLLDVSGKPYNPKNVARDAFEKEGVQQIKSGKDYYEQVVQKNGKPYLRAMTAVPVVLQKCILCHPHYQDARKNEAIGAISYAVPIE